MGFFDTVLEETNTSKNRPVTNTANDADILIKAENSANPLHSITIDDIPDSAVLFLDESPKAANDNEKKDTEQIVTTDISETATTESAVIIPKDIAPMEIIPQTVDHTNTKTDTLNHNVFGATQNVKTPAEVIANAVAELKASLADLSRNRDAIMTQVKGINEQIATLKDQAKDLTAKAKEIGTQETKVNETIALFEAQKL